MHTTLLLAIIATASIAGAAAASTQQFSYHLERNALPAAAKLKELELSYIQLTVRRVECSYSN